MSLQWEPQWEEVVVEDAGIRLRVLRDRVTGLYACPICGLGEDASYFFTVRDLIRHIVAHARLGKLERIRVSIEAISSEGEAARIEEQDEE